jgi:hypothetical protein
LSTHQIRIKKCWSTKSSGPTPLYWTRRGLLHTETLAAAAPLHVAEIARGQAPSSPSQAPATAAPPHIARGSLDVRSRPLRCRRQPAPPPPHVAGIAGWFLNCAGWPIQCANLAVLGCSIWAGLFGAFGEVDRSIDCATRDVRIP